MKTSKEFFERLQSDEAFAKEVTDAVAAKREAGATSYYETFIPVAADLGYEITKEDLDAVNAASVAELSDEELGKVAGGTSCLTALAVTSLCTILGSAAYSISKIGEAVSALEE